MTCRGNGSQLVSVTWEVTPSGEDGLAFIRIENADGSSRSRGSSVTPRSQMMPLQTALHKDCKSLNSACRQNLHYDKKAWWEFIAELFQHKSFCSVLFFKANSPWRIVEIDRAIWKTEMKCPTAVFTCSTKAEDIKVKTGAKARIKSGSVVLFPGYAVIKLHPTVNQSLDL